jgi:hypothetical protein
LTIRLIGFPDPDIDTPAAAENYDSDGFYVEMRWWEWRYTTPQGKPVRKYGKVHRDESLKYQALRDGDAVSPCIAARPLTIFNPFGQPGKYQVTFDVGGPDGKPGRTLLRKMIEVTR